MNSELKPKIRFKGFTDDWEQRKLNQFSKYITSNKTVSDVINDGIYDLYDANSIIGKVNNGVIKEEYITIIKDGSGVGKVRRLPKNTSFIGTMGGIVSMNSNIDFIYCNLLKTDFTKEINGATIPHVYYSSYGNKEYYIPKIEEQNKIAMIFNDIENLITLHQRKCDKLVELKKSLLEKMFPQNNSVIPEIRFRGFTDDWEQRKLGEIGKAISGIGFPEKEQGGDKGIPFYKVSDMNNIGNEREMHSSNNYVTDEQITKYHWNVINDVPAILFAKVGAAVMLDRKRLCRFPFLLDNNSMAFIFDKNKLDNEYSKALFDTIYLPTLIQVGALPSYNATQVEGMNIILPKIKEQKNLGDLFKKIDNLITLHQRKHDKLNKIKQSLLNDMFV